MIQFCVYINSQLTFVTTLLLITAVTSQNGNSQELANEIKFSDHKHIVGYRHKKKKNPDLFQGNKERKDYFEGWYFKMVSADGGSVISVIPGISLSEDGEQRHAFIQLIDGKTAATSYYSYPITDFAFSPEHFAIRIADNYFSKDSIQLNIQNDSTNIQGAVYMKNQVQLTNNNKKQKRKAIMGWYRSVPFMQCYHGVVSLNHDLNGSLHINDSEHLFDNGAGYTEKDWGQSMPSSWIWIQSNSFETKGNSFMLSVANIPWLGSSFTGFLGFFLHEGKSYRFGTYTKADLHIAPLINDTLKITISDKNLTYKIEAYRSNAGILKAPVNGSMDRRIAESIDASLKLTVINQNDSTVFNGRTSIAGLEIVGNLAELMEKQK